MRIQVRCVTRSLLAGKGVALLFAGLAVFAAYLAITSILTGQVQNLEYVAVLAVAFVL